MKYFLDTEFLEGEQDKRFIGFKYGKTKPTIDLISIGLVSEDGREYYSVSKEFNLYEAWNRYDLVWEQTYGDMRNIFPEGRNRKVYWIRENVLKPIYNELASFHIHNQTHTHFGKPVLDTRHLKFNYKSLKWLISKYGKTNKQIAEEVKLFIARPNMQGDLNTSEIKDEFNNGNESVLFEGTEVYTYFGDYDWAVFCWLFGKMIDLPKGFPMYSKDLKQTLDEKQILNSEQKRLGFTNISDLKHHPQYPKQESKHNALTDARWNKKLYEFLKTI